MAWLGEELSEKEQDGRTPAITAAQPVSSHNRSNTSAGPIRWTAILIAASSAAAPHHFCSGYFHFFLKQQRRLDQCQETFHLTFHHGPHLESQF
jgi:hypothetical protein